MKIKAPATPRIIEADVDQILAGFGTGYTMRFC
jgi:hypothetical protein